MSVIDQQHALSLLGGHEVIYKKILEKFLEAYENGIYSFNESNIEHDFDSVALKIHSVKGVAQNVGAMDVYQLVAQMDDDAKQRNQAKISEWLPAYNTAMAAAAQEIKRIL